MTPNPLRPLRELLSGTVSTETSPLAVVVRTQGKRASHLRDALTCLAAQTSDNFEVLLMVHSDDAEPGLGEVRTLVEDFEPAFSSRVGVVHVSGGRRARPLNAALARLKAEYVAFLDDDDLVMADWVESFVEAAGGGAIVRSGVAVREVSAPEDSHCHSYVVQSSLQFRYKLDFDRLRHFWENETPICTFAVPRSLVETVGLRFDEDLPVLEDWDFLMRCVAFASVRDTRKVTSVYQMWRSGESSASLHEVDVWQATQRVLQDRMNLRPLVLPAGSTDRLAKMCERLAELDATRIQLEDGLRPHATKLPLCGATRHGATSRSWPSQRASGRRVPEDSGRVSSHDQLASLAHARPAGPGGCGCTRLVQADVPAARIITLRLVR